MTGVAGGNGKQIFGDAWWLDSERASTLAGVLSAEAANASAVPPSAQLSGFAGQKIVCHPLVLQMAQI